MNLLHALMTGNTIVVVSVFGAIGIFFGVVACVLWSRER